MDDDDEGREFSKSIVYDFFTQAESTFDNMDEKLCVCRSSCLSLLSKNICDDALNKLLDSRLSDTIPTFTEKSEISPNFQRSVTSSKALLQRSVWQK